MKTVAINAVLKEGTGKKVNKILRNEGLVPGVIYGGENNVHFFIPKNDLNPVIYTGEFFKVDITIEGNTYTTIVKDMQFHPVTDEILHIDFQELVEGKRVKTSIPVNLKGRAEGVAVGGVLQHKLLKLNVRIKPEDMIESFTLDVSNLKLGSSLKVKDIQVGDIEILDSPNIAVASVIAPRALRSALTLSEEEEEGENTEEGENEATAE